MQIKEIKNQAKSAFAYNRYSTLLHSGLVYVLALNIAIIATVLAVINIWAIWYGIVLILLFLLALMPYKFGMAGFYLKVFKYEKQDGLHLFDGMNRKNLERVLVLYLIKFGIWLGLTVLLIVPGVIFAIKTSMATYLLRANPKLSAKGALKSSNKVMKSHSLDYFKLAMSFIGWFLLCVVTFGIASVWVSPYFNVAKVVFYKRELQGDTFDYRAAAKNAAIKQASGGAEKDETPFLTRSYDAVDSMPYELTAFDESDSSDTVESAVPIMCDTEPIHDFEPIIMLEEPNYGGSEGESEREVRSVPRAESSARRDTGNGYSGVRERGYETERRHDSARNAETVQKAETVRNAASGRSVADRITDRETAIPRSAENVRSTVANGNTESERGLATQRRTDTERRPSARSSEIQPRRISVSPLPGASIRIDENGRRSAVTVKPQETRNSAGDGETVRERLERLRADRMASRTDSRKDGGESETRNTDSGETDK